MKFARNLLAAAGLLVGAAAKTAANDINAGDADVKHIAIIGAGAAGASAAYHLRQFADEDGVVLNITLFEKTDHIGGRTLTVHPYGDQLQKAVELGASIFVEVNHILWNATQRYSLPLQSPGFDGLLGVWDGDQFLYTQDDSSSGWWNLLRLFWKYGTVPYRANKLMLATIDRFLNLYKAPYFPFRSLTTRAYELELTYVTGLTGEQFLEQNKITGPFAHDIIQASTRVNYASNLAKIHGLDTMVALAPEGASQVTGGNWQIFHSMVRESRADFQGNTTVTGISLLSGTEPPASKYVVQTKSTTTSGVLSEDELAFDNVVIATPFQFSGIHAADGVLQSSIDEIPYVELHVTLFASPMLLHAEFFKLPPATKVPTTVLTTLAADDDASSGVQGAGKAGFFSISTLQTIVNPNTLQEEYLYKIFSPEKLTPSFLSELLGAEVPESFTGSSQMKGDEESENALEVISWYYPHVFYSYPRAYPRVTFQDPILGDGLYYTSGIESFISTMETSALMGRNVARLIVDDIQGLQTGGAVVGKKTADETTKGNKQVVDEL